MMFRDMMRCVSGVCCAAVVMYANGALGMVEKMVGDPEKNSELVQLASLRQSDPSFYASIHISFPCFLGCCGEYPEKWPAWLARISQSVALLRSGKFSDDIKYARPAVSGISSSYTFEEIVKFCHSDLCDTSSRETLSSLFHLVPMVIRELPVLSEKEKAIKGVLTSYFPNKVVADYTAFLEKITPTKPLVSMEDAPLFRSVCHTVDAHMDSNF
jgi:hypothetical protein